jgi:teichoic acid transport system ATP-binding protein
LLLRAISDYNGIVLPSCLNKRGVTTNLVSHQLSAVKEICNRAIWLDGGEIKAEGDTEKVIKES